MALIRDGTPHLFTIGMIIHGSSMQLVLFLRKKAPFGKALNQLLIFWRFVEFGAARWPIMLVYV